METGIGIAIITGCFATFLSLITFVERRLDKRSLRKQKEEETKYALIKAEATKHIKEISDEIAKQYQKRVDALEKEVCILKQQVKDLGIELKAAYEEIERLRTKPKSTPKVIRSTT